MAVTLIPNWNGSPEDAVDLDLCFHFDDWEALFFGTLHAHKWDPYTEGDDIFEHNERNRRKFHESIPNYPTLRTIYDMYEDYEFDLTQTKTLREECIKLRPQATEPEAIKALRKLIYGCDQAIALNGNLFFSCD